MVISNYIKNFNKWYDIEYDNIMERCRKEKDLEELNFYKYQFNEATVCCFKEENNIITEEEYRK